MKNINRKIAKIILLVMLITNFFQVFINVSLAQERQTEKEVIQELEDNNENSIKEGTGKFEKEKEEMEDKVEEELEEKVEEKAEEKVEEIKKSNDYNKTKIDAKTIIELNKITSSKSLIKRKEVEKKLFLKTNETLEDIIKLLLDYKIQEEITEIGTVYKLDEVELVTENGEIVVTLEELKTNIISLDSKFGPILENLGGDKYNLLLEEISEINIKYKKVKELKNIRFVVKYIDPYHKNLEWSNINNQVKDIESKIEMLKLGIEDNGVAYYEIANVKKNIYNNSSNIKIRDYEEFVLKSITLNGNNIELGGQNKDIEIGSLEDLDYNNQIEVEVYAKPKIKKDVEDISFKNDHNFYEKKLPLKYTEGVVSLDGKDVSDLLSLDFNNRTENTEEYKLDESEYYYNDKYSIILNKDNEKDSEQELIERFIGNDYFFLKVNYYNTMFNFDGKYKELKIIHESNGQTQEKSIKYMSDMKYLYISPQNEGKIVNSSEDYIILEESGKKYYRVDLSKVDEIKIEYENNLPGIKITKYNTANKVLDQNGNYNNLGEERALEAYDGSIFTTTPIYEHEYNNDGYITMKDNSLADERYKIVKVEDSKVEILGYHGGNESALEGNLYENKNVTLNKFNEKPNNKTVEFRFINKDYSLYKIVYRTANGGNTNGDEYDLEVSENPDAQIYNIFQTDEYLVPNNTVVSLKPLDLKNQGYTLINNKNVGSEESQNIIYQNRDRNTFYLGKDQDFKLENKTINRKMMNVYTFIYSYDKKVLIPGIKEPETMKFRIVIKENDKVDEILEETLYIPKFPEEDYIVYLPVDKQFKKSMIELINDEDVYKEKFILAYGKFEGNKFIETDTKDDLENIEFIKISLGKDAEGDYEGGFFPTKKARSFKLHNLDEKIKNELEIIYNKDKWDPEGGSGGSGGGSGINETLETQNIKVYLRYFDGEKYVSDDKLYSINSIIGSKYDIKYQHRKFGKEIGEDPKELKELEYIDLKSEDDNLKTNTGITDKDGNNIRLKDESILDINQMMTLEKIDEGRNTIYLNYKLNDIEIPEIEDEEEIFEKYKYNKKFYYIPFQYFYDEGNESDIINSLWDMSHLEFDNISSGNGCSSKKIVPDKINIEKYEFVKEKIEEYYETTEIEKMEKEYEKVGRSTELLNEYKPESIKSYMDILQKKENELLESLQNPNEEKEITNGIDIILNESLLKAVQSELEFIKDIKISDLYNYLKQSNIDIREISGIDQKYEIGNEEIKINPNEEKAMLNKNNRLKDSYHQRKTGITYTDAVTKNIITETAYKTTRYSDLPMSIQNNIVDSNYIKNFLDDPKSNSKINDDVVISGVKNEEVEIPMIFIERSNYCKGLKETPPSKPEETKTTDILIRYALLQKDENGNMKKNEDGHIIKDEDGDYIAKEFYKFEYKSVPKILIGRSYSHKIPNIENANYIEENNNDDITELPEYKLINNVHKDIKNEMTLYYELEDGITELPEIKSSIIQIIGKDLDKEEGKNILYKDNFEGVLGNELDYTPRDYREDKDKLYLVDEDKNPIAGEYKEETFEFPNEEGQILTIIYYYKSFKLQPIPKEIEVSYVDSSEKKISDDSSWYVEYSEEDIEDIIKFKDISGYNKKSEEITITIKKDNIEFKTIDGYDIEQDGNIYILKKGDTKISELVYENNKAKIKLYYDKINNPTPNPKPEPEDRPITPGETIKDKEKIEFIYDANGGKVDDKDELVLKIEKGSKVKNDKIAKRPGYIFKGWSEDKEGNIVFDFSKPIYKSIKVYAIWEEVKLDKVNHFEYIQGYPDKSIRPVNNITREEVATVFYRLLEENYKEKIYSLDNDFKDVSKNRWSNKHISTLQQGNIIMGYEDEEFKPGNYITRAEVAVIASRFDNLEKVDHNFTDVSNHWAEEYIGSASKKGWIVGYEDKTFKPDQYITRAEFVTLVNRVLNRGVRKENILKGINVYTDLQTDPWYYPEFVEATNGHIYDRTEDGNRTSEKWLELKVFYTDM